jgi:DivIVA domain-containing protein
VAEAGFTTTRRGYQPDEVRAFLTSVAAELGRLQERERQLDAELREARQATPPQIELDDETVTQLLGEETLRVLQTARESASQIKIRAEDTAARTLREANEEANRVRQDAEVEAARKRHDAVSEAEAEVALAKQQGREMVTEARAYRERVLSDLERRTKLARQHIEDLRQGRDRLLQVFERARLVAVDVTSELQSIDEPEEYVSFSHTTGPVPLMVPASSLAARAASSVAETPTDDVIEDDTMAMALADAIAAVDAEQGDATLVDVETDEEAAEPVAPQQQRADHNVVSLFRDRGPAESHDDAPEAAAGEAADEAADASTSDVDDLFARLRSEVPDTPADILAEGVVDTPDEGVVDESDAHAGSDMSDQPVADDADAPQASAFTRRDEVIVPLIVAASRKLKRVLADEQNGVLDTLRKKEVVGSIDALLPDADAHVAMYVDALAEELLGAAAGGATELGATDTKTLRRKLEKADAVGAARVFLRSNLVGPLRARIERSIVDGAGDNDDVTKSIRSVYREWKTQQIDDQLDDVFRFAYGGGIAALVEPGTAMVWTIDPNHRSCPDCEDNSLGGAVAAGESFPTGHTSAPAHPGCRCLMLPASG